MEREVRILIRWRPDGGLRAWSEDLPGLVLSNKDPRKVLADLEPALKFILSKKLGCEVAVHREGPLPTEIAQYEESPQAVAMIKRAARAAGAAKRKMEAAASRRGHDGRAAKGAQRPRVLTYAAEPCIAW